MKELLQKMKDVFVKYAGDMIVEKNVNPADFFDKFIKMALNFMSWDQKALYKDHCDQTSKFRVRYRVIEYINFEATHHFLEHNL